ncbi:MAG: sporadic carbohydrate cluster 2OG-Fe(II) oxygenase [Holophagaceae bacterium]
MTKGSFLTAGDQALGNEFLEAGFVVRPCESPTTLDTLRQSILQGANNWLRSHDIDTTITDLGNSHLSIPKNLINDIRLHLFANLNTDPLIRREYFDLAASLLQGLVGNELAMQNKVNLSIQQPHDETSVLELHSDVWTGDSPFQVVLWVPLTDSTASNAMFFVSPKKSREAYSRAIAGELRSMGEIQKAYASHLKPIEIRYGDILIFDSSCFHGNQINTTSHSRWSLNCRLTSLLAPSTTPERRLGPYYTPIMVRPATLMGLLAIDNLGTTEQ